MTDTLIGITPWSINDLSIGQSVAFSATYQIQQKDLDLGTLFNQATAQGYLGNQVIVSNQASITIESSMIPQIGLTIEYYQGQILSPMTPSLILAGTPVTYTYVIKNTGNQTLFAPS